MKVNKYRSIIVLMLVLGTIANQVGGVMASMPFSLLLLIGMFTYSYKYPKYCIYVVLFLSSEALGLLPKVSVGVFTISWADLCIIYVLWMYIIAFTHNYQIKIDAGFRVVFVFLLFRVIGAIAGYIIYDQNILTGLLVLRPTYVIMSYPIFKAMIGKEITSESCISAIIKFTKILSIVYIIELILIYIGINITSFGIAYRWGYRMYASNTLQFISLLLIVFRIVNGKKEQYDYIWCAVFSLVIVFINQSRMMILSSVICLVLLLLISPNYKRKYALVLVCVIAACALLTNNSVRTTIVESILESNSNTTGNMATRLFEQKYFSDKLRGHELFGVGTPNQQKGVAAEYGGHNVSGFVNNGSHYISGYYLSDLGVFAIKYYWGYLGYFIYWCIYIFATFAAFRNIFLKHKFDIKYVLPILLLFQGIVTQETQCALVADPIQILIILLVFCTSRDTTQEKISEN